MMFMVVPSYSSAFSFRNGIDIQIACISARKTVAYRLRFLKARVFSILSSFFMQKPEPVPVCGFATVSVASHTLGDVVAT